MELDLTEKEIREIGNIKNILRDVILGNVGQTIDEIVEIFREVIEDCYRDMNIQIEDVSIISQNNLRVVMFVKHKKAEFELSMADPEENIRAQGFEALINKCEPWRKNRKLAESDAKLKEWANSFK